MKHIKKILIANRGEIAIRVMRTASDMGITTVAIYSDADKDALFVKKADEAIAIGGTHAAESYLNHDKIIAAAKQSGADAIHPGYGFIAENADFSKRCKDEGLIFIGPSAEAMAVMGSKRAAKEIMQKAGVPVVPGYHGQDQSYGKLKQEAEKIGYPVLLKASAGGGGKGMRIVHKPEDLQNAIESATREAEKSFSDGTLLMEKYFPWAKHIEFQVFGDEHGNYTHFFERECSLQRRYQKVIEESPSPSLTTDLRKKMGEAAVAAVKSINYTSAGTVEFLLDKQGNFYFLEVNARLQVEHPVTEETTGLDLVRLQIEIAQGLSLKVNAQNVTQHGHSIECRICAEDPENNFFPSTGTILFWHEAELKGLRYDSGVQSGSKVHVFYDSLIAKVIVTGGTRTEAISRMQNALHKLGVLGIRTNKDFLIELLANPGFVNGSFDTGLIEREYPSYKRKQSESAEVKSAVVAMLYQWHKRRGEESVPHSLNGWRNIFYQPQFCGLEIGGRALSLTYRYLGDGEFEVNAGGKTMEVELICTEENILICAIDHYLKTYFVADSKDQIYLSHPESGNLYIKVKPRFTEPGRESAKGDYASPMPGEIVKVLVKSGESVKAGKGLVVMSSMKMETTIEAREDGHIEEIFVTEKAFVEANTVLLKMKQ